jgi:hypothetical protein
VLKYISVFIAAVAILAQAVPAFSGETYDAVVAGRTCGIDKLQQVTCAYNVGKDLRISIPGIGTDDVGVTILKSDFDGDYYATFGLMHQCLIVKTGGKLTSIPGKLPDFAFISPKNGKDYQDWESCKSGL